MNTSLNIDPLTSFRLDPYPWSGKDILFAGGGPHGLQSCKFTAADRRTSMSGHKKWLLELDRPVIRHVPSSGIIEQREEANRLWMHYTRLVWADECVIAGRSGAFGRVNISLPNGSVVTIPDQKFTHFRRADFVNGFAVLDRFVTMSLVYVDDDQPITGIVQIFPHSPGSDIRLFSSGRDDSAQGAVLHGQ